MVFTITFIEPTFTSSRKDIVFDKFEDFLFTPLMNSRMLDRDESLNSGDSGSRSSK